MISRTLYITLFFALTLSLRAQLWSGASGDPSGWKYVGWFGWFHSPNEDAGWLYHLDLGWLYADGSSQDSISFYGVDLGGWFFSGDGLYPSLYLFELDHWVYFFDYNGLSSFPLQYWDFENGLWVSSDSLAFESAPANPLGSGYTLKQSFVLIRHGQRYPEVDLVNGTQYDDLSALTSVGEMQEQNLGRIFATKLASLNLTTSNVFLTADDYDTPNYRTVLSAEYFVVGLGLYATPDEVPLSFDGHIFDKYTDDPCVGKIDDHVAKTSAWTTPSSNFTNEYQTSWNNDSGGYYASDSSGPVDTFDFSSAYSLADNLQYTWITGGTIPSGFTADDINKAWGFSNIQNYLKGSYPYHGWSEYRVFLEAVRAGIEGEPIYETPTSGVKFFLFGGHDSTIDGVLSALYSAPQENPIFASFVEISVYTSTADSQDYVAASYNGTALDLSQLPGGANPCPVDVFTDYLKYGPGVPSHICNGGSETDD